MCLQTGDCCGSLSLPFSQWECLVKLSNACSFIGYLYVGLSRRQTPCPFSCQVFGLREVTVKGNAWWAPGVFREEQLRCPTCKKRTKGYLRTRRVGCGGDGYCSPSRLTMCSSEFPSLRCWPVIFLSCNVFLSLQHQGFASLKKRVWMFPLFL